MLTNNFHKSLEGYYINHDLLMAVNEENKAKLITYHIALNTPNKLDPEDRYKILNKMGKDRNYNKLKSVILTLGTFGLFKCRNNLLFAPLIYSSIFYCFHDYSEKKMLRSSLLSEMAIKYKFSTFDFNNSKKESQIGSLIRQIKDISHLNENV